MSSSTLACKTERRRHEVRRQHFNGLDYLEASDDQRTLTVYFLGAAPESLGPENVGITGGERIRDIQVLDVKVCPQQDPELDNCIVVTVDRPGDFSTYTLCLVNLPDDSPFDPRYRCLSFTFKASCPTELDCKTSPVCPPEVYPEPEIDYLAKDYASFRQLLLDRLAVVTPEWTERHVPDLGITLVELFAYVGDYLSYYQDAVATEAYLDTARQRISVRRHVRLVDYVMHEGCNARTWVHIDTSIDATVPAAQLSFLTTFANAPEAEGRLLTWDDLRGVPGHLYEVFEPLVDASDAEIHLYGSHNEIRFYTWGDTECCLPRGATSASLIDGPARPLLDESEEKESEEKKPDILENTAEEELSEQDEKQEKREEYPDDGDDIPPTGQVPLERLLHLKPGDVLIVEEVIGPKTGDPDDADPAHRHAVRLTHVEPVVDPLNGQPLLEISWAEEDALPFALCLSVVGPPPECALIEDVSVARGNVVLADHGRRLEAPEDLGCVPAEVEEAICEREGRPSDVIQRPGRFPPTLGEGPLTFSQPLPPSAPGARLLHQDPRQALPWIRLSSCPDPRCKAGETGEGAAKEAADTPSRPWAARRDLLASQADDDHFVVEMDDHRRAHLRFGDGDMGSQPESGLVFEAIYRIGNGPDGNVGADKLLLAVSAATLSGLTLTPRNPLPARGGTAPEPVAEVKLFAPHAFRQVLERAITPDDYAELAAQHAAVQRAAAELRWNGSWYEVRVAIDPLGQAEADASLLEEIEKHLYRFRRIGHDLAVRPARYVALDLVLDVCVKPSYLRGHVKAALLERFSTRCLPDGSFGFFHPDELSFGESISLSRLVAAAQKIPGVESVKVTKLQRLFEGPNGEIEQGLLPIGPLEIARLDNDPNFPEYGRIRFELRGGR
ncbi:MAG: putative baseplate assembly protein [Pseudomonadota bacterium]|nr:putative baseplate assembly protein [Pseudomonadota bacterium]